MGKVSLRLLSGHRNLVAAFKIRNDNPGARVVENDPPGFILIEREGELVVHRHNFDRGADRIKDTQWESILLNKQGRVKEWDENVLVLSAEDEE